MVNLLGDLWWPGDQAAPPRAPDWERLLALPGAHLHLYGKADPRPGRKMGHLTVLASSTDEAARRALAGRAALLGD
jgi:5-(carboxyamino)imidazole ribonucleotide synthase